MRCSNCGAEISDSTKFCPECGTKIIKKIFCQKCGAELPDTAKFCPECGAKIIKKIFCPNCGAELSNTAKFCPECGTPVNQNTEIALPKDGEKTYFWITRENIGEYLGNVWNLLSINNIYCNDDIVETFIDDNGNACVHAIATGHTVVNVDLDINSDEDDSEYNTSMKFDFKIVKNNEIILNNYEFVNNDTCENSEYSQENLQISEQGALQDSKNHQEMMPESAQAALQDSKYADSFSEDGFWDKIKGVAGKAGKKVIKEALLLWYVLKSPDVPWTQKSAIIGALGYFVAPLDLIPDFIPVAGFTDDAAALVAVHEMVQASITPEIEEQAENKIRELFD